MSMAGDFAAAPVVPVAVGAMVVVVGPSGAGKDSVMSYAFRHFAGSRVNRNLPGSKKHAANFNCLRVWANSGRSFFGRNYFHFKTS